MIWLRCLYSRRPRFVSSVRSIRSRLLELPDDLPVQGNLDPLAMIAGGDELRTAVRRILDAFAGRPHIFNLGHGILQDTPIAHVQDMLRQVKGER